MGKSLAFSEIDPDGLKKPLCGVCTYWEQLLNNAYKGFCCIDGEQEDIDHICKLEVFV